MTRVRVAYVESRVSECIVDIPAPYAEGDLLAAVREQSDPMADVVSVEWHEQLADNEAAS